MPMMQYLSVHNPPLVSEEWQAWVIIGIVVVGIIAVGLLIWKSRKL